jgi:hypothetical protein
MIGLVSVSGCGGLGKLHSVSGTITVDGKAVPEGSQVNFWPEKPLATPATIMGKCDANGKYTMTTNGKSGVPSGKYKVTVTTIIAGGGQDPSKMVAGAPPEAGAVQRAASDKYEGQGTTPLSVEVPAGPFDFALTR